MIQGKSHSFSRSPAALAGGKGYTCLCIYQWFAPGWGAGQSTGIRLRKAHVGGDFDIHNRPQGGKFDSTATLKSGEDLEISEWSAILENTQKSFERVSRVQGWLNER